MKKKKIAYLIPLVMSSFQAVANGEGGAIVAAPLAMSAIPGGMAPLQIVGGQSTFSTPSSLGLTKGLGGGALGGAIAGVVANAVTQVMG